jgi:hypothetical protein
MIITYSRASLSAISLCFALSIVALPPLALAAGMGGAPSGAGTSGSSSAASSASSGNGGASGAATGPSGGGHTGQGYMAVCEQGKAWDIRNNKCL